MPAEELVSHGISHDRRPAYDDEPPDNVAASAEPLASSWSPVDLTAVLSGDWRPPQPTVGRRDDGVGLFYPAKVHTIASETEAGKTWLALRACADVMTNDERAVAYLDFEDAEGTIVGRLLAMQVPAEVIRARLRYLRPVEALMPQHRAELREAIDGADLVIIDGVTEAMTTHGLNPLDNHDAAKFGARLLRPVANLGPAVVALDHVPKDKDNRGRYAIGAVHKLNGLDGAAYTLINRIAFGIGRTGRSTLRLSKDRHGQLRRHALPGEGSQWFADLVITSHAAEFVEANIEPPPTTATATKPTATMAKVMALFAAREELSKNQIQTMAGGKAATVRQAVAWLQADEYLSADERGRPLRVLRPYPVESGLE